MNKKKTTGNIVRFVLNVARCATRFNIFPTPHTTCVARGICDIHSTPCIANRTRVVVDG